MTFLVFENDPVVRADICEALAAEFGTDAVTVAETLESCAEHVKDICQPIIAVLSITTEQLVHSVEKISEVLLRANVVIIGNQAPDHGVFRLPVSFVQRPFSSEHLISVIRGASIVPREDQ